MYLISQNFINCMTLIDSTYSLPEDNMFTLSAADRECEADDRSPLLDVC